MLSVLGWVESHLGYTPTSCVFFCVELEKTFRQRNDKEHFGTLVKTPIL